MQRIGEPQANALMKSARLFLCTFLILSKHVNYSSMEDLRYSFSYGKVRDRESAERQSIAHLMINNLAELVYLINLSMIPSDVDIKEHASTSSLGSIGKFEKMESQSDIEFEPGAKLNAEDIMRMFKQSTEDLIDHIQTSSYSKSHPLIISHYGCYSIQKIASCVEDMRLDFGAADEEHLKSFSRAFDTVRDNLVNVICRQWEECNLLL